MAIATGTSTTVVQERSPTPRLSATTPSKEAEFPDIKTIKDSIPAHCFESSVATSMGYVVRDVALAAALYYGALTYIPQITNDYGRYAAWMAYGYAQGLVGTGIWILAHEAGHGAFSRYQKLNDFVGWALHSYLLVPYFSWQSSHRRHHQFTGNMEKDMVFVPAVYDSERHHEEPTTPWSMMLHAMEDTPVYQFLTLIIHQLFGWQFYLLTNASAGSESLPTKQGRWYRLSHFDPLGDLFRSREASLVLMTDIGLAITMGALYLVAQSIGWSKVFLLYGVPYFWVHHWLIAITYLHHNHPSVYHYSRDGWTFVKGALSTIDRDFGWVDRHLFHGIIGTHVVHHLFPRIPFYKAEEATAAMKPLLGDLYHYEGSSFMNQLWQTFTTCKYVEENPQIPGQMRWKK